jgi:hypothetical protein
MVSGKQYTEALGGADDADDGQNDRRYDENRQQHESDEHEAQQKGHETVDEVADLEVQQLSTLGVEVGALILLHEPHDEGPMMGKPMKQSTFMTMPRVFSS